MAQFKRYLGDGIEFDYNGHQVILTSQHGRVYLKPQIVENFKSVLVGLKSEIRKQKEAANTTPEDYFRRMRK